MLEIIKNNVSSLSMKFNGLFSWSHRVITISEYIPSFILICESIVLSILIRFPYAALIGNCENKLPIWLNSDTIKLHPKYIENTGEIVGHKSDKYFIFCTGVISPNVVCVVPK